jgi:hypothetical protein
VREQLSLLKSKANVTWSKDYFKYSFHPKVIKSAPKVDGLIGLILNIFMKKKFKVKLGLDQVMC